MPEQNADKLIPDDQIEIFLKTVNERGFILEVQAHEVLQNTKIDSINKNPLYETIEGNQIETDALVTIGDCHFIIECKRTNYNWAFMKEKNSPDYISFIRRNDSDYHIKDLKFNRPASSHGFGVAINDESKNKESAIKTAYKDVRDHAKQVLAATEAYMRSHPAKATYIPTIITNAKLFKIDYDKEKIDENGDLGYILNQKNTNEIYYNIPQMVRNPFTNRPIVPKGGYIERHHMKSVLIVNIKNLHNLPQIARNIRDAFPEN